MTDEQRDVFTDLLMLMVERMTTLSVEVQTLRVLLEQRGEFSAAEFDEKSAELRKHWELQEHPHATLSSALPQDEYFARIRQILTPSDNTEEEP